MPTNPNEADPEITKPATAPPEIAKRDGDGPPEVADAARQEAEYPEDESNEG